MASMNNDEAKAYAKEHLVYELDMLAFCYEKLKEGIEDRVLKNVIIESYAMHLRSWISFFYPKNPRPDDVTWKDFLDPNSTWQPLVVTPNLENAYEQANKQVAHMTTLRYEGMDQRKHWEIAHAQEIFDILQSYIKEVLDLRVDNDTIKRLTRHPK